MGNSDPWNNQLFSPFDCSQYTTEGANLPVPLHSHFFAELIRVRSGSLTVRQDDNTCLLNSGDAIFIAPMAKHALDYGSDGASAEYVILHLDIELFGIFPSYFPDPRGIILEAERHGLLTVYTSRELKEHHIDYMIDQCVQEYRTHAYGYDLRIRSFLFLIATTVIRRWISKGFVPRKNASGLDPFYTLPSYITQHIQEPLKVEKLAEYCGLSYPWFARKFRETYGVSCKEYIENARIRLVEHYLQFTDCDLDYIRQHTGYADCSHLVRDFRKLRSMTPGQFRKACRQRSMEQGRIPKA